MIDMSKWIKKVATTRLDERARVIDSLAGNQTNHAPSIHIVNQAITEMISTALVPLTNRVTALETNANKISWSSAVDASLGAVTCTIQDAKIATTSILEPFSSNSSGDTVVVKNMTVTAGQVVLTFDALLEATSFKVRITNL